MTINNYMTKNFKILSVIATTYITVTLFLGLVIKDDYFLLAFPSWPIFIGCSEDCDVYRLIIATIMNGIFLGLGYLFVKYLFKKDRL